MENHKSNLVIILGSQFHLRSFFSGSIYATLSRSFHIELVVDDCLLSAQILENHVKTSFSVSTLAKFLFQLVLDASMVRNVWKSSSFRFRIRRMLLGDFNERFPIRPRGLIRLLRSILLASPILYWLLVLLYRVAVLQSLQSIAKSEDRNPQLICAWSQSIEPSSMLALLWARKCGAKSVLIFDNWDNLSSKAVLIDQPDAVVCFGKQSAEFATRIHHIPLEKTFPIGSSRFDSYTDSSVITRKSNSILIAGSSLALEDLAILKEMSSIWAHNPPLSRLKKSRISYRPHPAPQGLRIDLSRFNFPGILLDRNMELNTGDDLLFQPQSEVVSTLSKQRLVIGSPTTLIIEALLCGIPVIIPTFGQDQVRTSNALMMEKLEHLKVIPHLKNVQICDSTSSLQAAIVEVLEDSQSSSEDDLLEYVVTTRPGTFAYRLNRVLIELLPARDQQR